MFSKKMVMIFGIIVLIAVNILIISTVNKDPNPTVGSAIFALVSPFQQGVSRCIRSVKDLWRHYFFLVSAAEENDRLKAQLARLLQENRRSREIQLTNERLRALLNFRTRLDRKFVPAEIVGRDPSPWYQTVIIDKGRADGVQKGCAVLVPDGVAGQVVDVSDHYAKVLLSIDQNSAVDALVQRTRARGIIKGDGAGGYAFSYVLRKHDIEKGDIVVSSGLDGVFPKGVRIGRVTEIRKEQADIFQEVTVSPFVDFERLEEVLVMLNPAKPDLAGK